MYLPENLLYKFLQKAYLCKFYNHKFFLDLFQFLLIYFEIILNITKVFLNIFHNHYQIS